MVQALQEAGTKTGLKALILFGKMPVRREAKNQQSWESQTVGTLREEGKKGGENQGGEKEAGREVRKERGEEGGEEKGEVRGRGEEGGGRELRRRKKGRKYKRRRWRERANWATQPGSGTVRSWAEVPGIK